MCISVQEPWLQPLAPYIPSISLGIIHIAHCGVLKHLPKTSFKSSFVNYTFIFLLFCQIFCLDLLVLFFLQLCYLQSVLIPLFYTNEWTTKSWDRLLYSVYQTLYILWHLYVIYILMHLINFCIFKSFFFLISLVPYRITFNFGNFLCVGAGCISKLNLPIRISKCIIIWLFIEVAALALPLSFFPKNVLCPSYNVLSNNLQYIALLLRWWNLSVLFFNYPWLVREHR